MRHCIVCFFILMLSACSLIPTYTYQNERLSDTSGSVGLFVNSAVPDASIIASDDIDWDINLACRNSLNVDVTSEQPVIENRGRCDDLPKDPNFVGLALSGGGSRAAIFSALVMFELEKWNLMPQVDVLSSVSGGSFTAALYATSCDSKANCPQTYEGTERLVWRQKEVIERLSQNFLIRVFGRKLLPWNLLSVGLTHYDNTDILAEVIEDKLFDQSSLGFEAYTFRDLNPQRANLIINATNNTNNETFPSTCNATLYNFERNFRFSQQMFKCISSDLASYSIGRAVAASSAFPGVFNYQTLRNFSDTTRESRENIDDEQYIHLFDGGTTENLGLKALTRLYEQTTVDKQPERSLVIAIDAAGANKTASYDDDEPMKFVDHFIDTNFLDTYDTLMEQNRKEVVCSTQDLMQQKPDHRKLLHIKFDDLPLNLSKAAMGISTSLNIKPNEVKTLRAAAKHLVCINMNGLIGSDFDLNLTQPQYCRNIAGIVKPMNCNGKS